MVLTAAPAAPAFDAELIARHDLNGPRYTSYPTAPHFDATFGEADYRASAAASNEEPIPRPLSLYVHLPFCPSPCFYCGCNRVITRNRGEIGAYLVRLEREIALQAALFDRDRQVLQLHLGGGTPNYLDLDQMAALMDALRSGFTFGPESQREFSIEIDPRLSGAGTMAGLARLGFNRASFGVQDFDPAVQEAINRVQGIDQTMGVIADARAAGFRSVSVDLIYGLPLQTLEGFTRTLEIVIAGRPDRIAVYGYAHLPEVFKAQRQIDPADMPPASTRLALLGLAIDTLRQAGYQYLGMDHFALPQDELAKAQSSGDLQRNFQGYSTHAECDLVGLGVSAIGKVGDCYAANARDLTGYYAAIDAGHLAVMRGHRLTEDDTLRGAIIQALMCSGDLDMQAFGERHGFDFGQRFGAELNRLEPLVADGLVRIESGHLRVTPRGRLLVRLVAMAFDAYLSRPGEKAPRYSRVI